MTVSLDKVRAATVGTIEGDYLAAVNGRGQYVTVTWQSDVKTAAKHGVARRKITTATVRTGVEYRNLAQNEGRETGELPWGHWKIASDGTSLYPWILEHDGKDSITRLYLRVYVDVATMRKRVRSQYFVDNGAGYVKVSRDAFLAYDSPSVRAKANETPTVDVLTLSPCVDNVTSVGVTDFDPTDQDR